MTLYSEILFVKDRN